MLPLADAEAIRLLASVPEESRAESFWIVLHDVSVVAGDDGGGLTILTELKLTRRIGRIFRTLKLSSVIDVLYKLVARYRGALGKLVPEGIAPYRYP